MDIDTPLLGVQAESSESAVSAQVLNLINEFITAIVTMTGKTFKIDPNVGENIELVTIK